MFGKINPKQMSAMMKQMGISQTEIDASKVIIEKSDGSRIIIENPNVVKVSMNSQESFQVTGEIKEESTEDEEDSKLAEDIQAVVEQTGVSEDMAAIELEKNDGDIAETIISLSKKK
jgi:alpha-NAC-related protein